MSILKQIMEEFDAMDEDGSWGEDHPILQMAADIDAKTSRIAELERRLAYTPGGDCMSYEELAAEYGKLLEAQQPTVTDGCLYALKNYSQADADGAMVNVSRQALDEAIAVLQQES